MYIHIYIYRERERSLWFITLDARTSPGPPACATTSIVSKRKLRLLKKREENTETKKTKKT